MNTNFLQDLEPYFLPLSLKQELDVVSNLEDGFTIRSMENFAESSDGNPAKCNIIHKSNQNLVIGNDITITKTESDLWIANIPGRERSLMLNSMKNKKERTHWCYFENGKFRKGRFDKMFTESFGLEKDELVWRIKSIKPDRYLYGVTITKTFVCKATRTSTLVRKQNLDLFLHLLYFTVMSVVIYPRDVFNLIWWEALCNIVIITFVSFVMRLAYPTIEAAAKAVFLK